MLYPIAIRNQDQQFIGILPDLPDLTIFADNIAEVISQARFTVMTHLLALYAQGKPLPNGSDISDHLSPSNRPNPFAGVTWAIISIDAARIEGTTVKLSIDLPEPLLTRARHYLANQSQMECPLPTHSQNLNELITKALQAYLPSYQNS